jgi:hypothetical protein
MAETAAILEIGGPVATCGHCRFSAPLRGSWSVEAGRLVWRADADPQPGRGPDLDGCCENGPVVFSTVAVDGAALTATQITALRATAALDDA